MPKVITRNYGSIPHLSTSKMGQKADKKISIGQELILTSKARDSKDLIIVTEKIDGSNVGVVKKNGVPLPVSRAGWHTDDSPYKQHHYFTKFVYDNIGMFNWLPENWRICGEWCIQTCGTILDITDECPFIAFDIFNDNNERILFSDFNSLCVANGVVSVPVLHIGSPLSIDNAVALLGTGHYGKPENPEGCVWRCERNGKVDFLAKWVRGDKEDGKYMDLDMFNIGYEKWI